MGYSVNLYLDSAISVKQQKTILASSDNEAKKELDKILTTKQLQIFIYLRFEGRLVKAYTERKCTQKQWDFDKQETNPRYFKTGSPEVNTYLSKLKAEIAKLHEECIRKNVETTKELVKEVIDKLNNKKHLQPNKITFEKAFEEYIEVAKHKTANNTIKGYTTAYNHLKGFMKHTNKKLNFENITLDFEANFKKYLSNEVKLIDNTISKYMKTIKSFMRYCIDREYTENMHFIKFKVKGFEGEIYYLTVEELFYLYNFDFKNDRLSKVRDVFCFGCFTGLRYSDLEKLKHDNIKGDELHLTIEKTKKDTIIPLNDFALTILNKYIEELKPLPVISNQKMNNYLKEIGQIVGFDEPVKIKKYVNAKLIEEYVPKYEVLTCHVARKTFTTTSLILGMTETETKEITGHTDGKSFRRYVKIADTHKKAVMKKTWSLENIKKL